MSTRSTIAIIKKDDTVEYIYCHSDGYLSYNGAILQTYYSDPEDVKKLISLGNMSSLGTKIVPKGEHSFDYNKREEGVCVYYGRDRGETGQEPSKFKDFNEFYGHQDFQEYNYVYKEKNNKWYLFDEDALKLKPLKTMIKKIKDDLPPEFRDDFINQLNKEKVEKDFNKLNKEVKSVVEVETKVKYKL